MPSAVLYPGEFFFRLVPTSVVVSTIKLLSLMITYFGSGYLRGSLLPRSDLLIDNPVTRLYISWFSRPTTSVFVGSHRAAIPLLPGIGNLDGRD